jgi:hypothetical protein
MATGILRTPWYGRFQNSSLTNKLEEGAEDGEEAREEEV